MFRTGRSPLTFAERVSDLDSEGSRSGYPLPAFLCLTGCVANGLASDLALSRVLPVLTVVCGQAPRASLSTSLVCKVERDTIPLVTQVKHIAWHILIVMYRYFCHGPYSFPAEDSQVALACCCVGS